MQPPSPADVTAAGRLLAGVVVHTPAAVSATLSEICRAEIVVKFENLQFTGSFKDRGATVKLTRLTDAERERGVIAVSAGNHAQGVAHRAAQLGIAATIVMPDTTPFTKVARTRTLGATVVQAGNGFTEATAVADELAARSGAIVVAPYDDPDVIAGQGTVGLELFADVGDLDVVVVPVGGGGLIAGVALAAEAAGRDVEIVGVQSELYPSMVAALGGRVGSPPSSGGVSIADGIAVKHPGALTTAVLAERQITVSTVPEARIEEAIGLYAEVEKTVAEGAGAAALALVLDQPDRFAGRRVGLILSGGNIDPRLLASVLVRSLYRQGRLSRLRVEADDAPGRLASVSKVIAELGGNVVEVGHERSLLDVPVRRVDLDLVVETLDRDHLLRIADALVAGGHPVRVLG